MLHVRVVDMLLITLLELESGEIFRVVDMLLITLLELESGEIVSARAPMTVKYDVNVKGDTVSGVAERQDKKPGKLCRVLWLLDRPAPACLGKVRIKAIFRIGS